jgi:hypothetical protein
MSHLRIPGTAALVLLASSGVPAQSARAAEPPVVTPVMLKALSDVPGKEALMIVVDYPPAAPIRSIVTTLTPSFMCWRARLSCR